MTDDLRLCESGLCVPVVVHDKRRMGGPTALIPIGLRSCVIRATSHINIQLCFWHLMSRVTHPQPDVLACIYPTVRCDPRLYLRATIYSRISSSSALGQTRSRVPQHFGCVWRLTVIVVEYICYLVLTRRLCMYKAVSFLRHPSRGSMVLALRQST